MTLPLVEDASRATPSAAVENYLKTIYALEVDSDAPVGTGAIAARLHVSAPSASNMSKRLERAGLVELLSGRGVRLTGPGRRAALSVIRRHRILETFLYNQLGLPWEEVHGEAEVLEHAFSPALIERLWQHIGCPTYDPSGDPIPPAGADHMDLEPDEPVSELAPRQPRRLVRVSEANPDALRFLTAHGIAPGSIVEVVATEPFGAGLRVMFDDAQLAIGPDLAKLLFVERVA